VAGNVVDVPGTGVAGGAVAICDGGWPSSILPAVDTRYPGNSATRRQAKAALRWAAKVRTAARTLLGFPLRSRRRGK